MKATVIQQILEQFGKAERSGQDLKMPTTTEAHLFVAIGSDAMTVQKVVHFEIRDEFLVATSAKGEQFCFGYDAISGVKFEKIDEKKGERNAGFGR